MPPASGARDSPFFDRAWLEHAVSTEKGPYPGPGLPPIEPGLVAGCLDATAIGATDGAGDVRRLARRAVGIGAAAVCVYPVFARTALEELRGSGVALALVAGGFPDGLSPLDARLLEVRIAVDMGADEIDVPIRRDLVREAKWEALFDELATIREAADTTTLKVILSTPEIPTAAGVAGAARVAIMAGADFLKTATGREAASPTLDAGAGMCAAILEAYARTGRRVGFKAAGGIRDAAAAAAWVGVVATTLGADWLTPSHFRIGSSHLHLDPALNTSGEGIPSL